MNLAILQPEQFINAQYVQLLPRQHQHVLSVLKCGVGDKVTIGQLCGGVGEGTIVEQSAETTIIEVLHLDTPPPPPIPVTLVLGLPRPRVLHRTLQTLATLGVESIHLLQTARVEKSFWQTPLLQPEAVKEQMLLGLEQAKATQLPTIEYHKRFRPFMEDSLPDITTRHRRRIVAHPGPYPLATSCEGETSIVAIGPEGGFLEQECSLFRQLGFLPVQLGPRILKVETAITTLIAKLY